MDSTGAHATGKGGMEARSMQAGLAAPLAKDGGIAAGITAVIREVGNLLTTSGGLVVVVIGVVGVMTITSAALATVPDQERATVATAAFSVLGTFVGAYFGVRVGARGKEEAEAARTRADERVERLAFYVEPDNAASALASMDRTR